MSDALTITPLRLRFRAAEGEADGNTLAWWLAEQVGEAEALAADVREAVRKYLADYQGDAVLFTQMVGDLGRNALPDLQFAGETLCRILAASVRNQGLIDKALRKLPPTAQPCTTEEVERLRQAGREQARRLAWVSDNWPWPDHVRMHRALAAFGRGEGRPTLDFLDELCHPAHS